MAAQLPELNNRNGFSIIELLIAGAIISGLALSAASIGGSIFNPLRDLSKNVYESIGQDLSVRALAFQFSNSELMRGASDGSPWVTCPGKTILAASTSSQTTSLAALKDNFTVVFARIRTLGATNSAQTNTISVPDAALFYPGMNVLVTSLDGQKNQGVFSVESVNLALQTVTLTDSVSQPPPEIGCKIMGRSNASILFNPLQLRKFSVLAIGFVKYEVEAMPEGNKQLKLMSRTWPVVADLQQQAVQEVISHFISMKISESFTNTTSTKGVYQAQLNISRYNTKVSGKVTVAQITATAGYTLSGVEILNQAAVPAPPSVDNLFVSCGLNGTPMLTDFVDLQTTTPKPSTYGKIIPVYRIDVFYSESNVIDASSPSISASLSATNSIQCWSLKDVDCATHTLNGLPTTGPVNFLPITLLPASSPGRDHSCIDLTNALVIPMFCAVPTDAQAVTKIHYTSTTAGPQTVNCSDGTLPGLAVQYIYNPAAPNHPSNCNKDGSIYIGRLINDTINPPQSGPVLAVKTNGCNWSNGDTSCNAFNVLANDPNASLVDVALTPEDISIKNGSSTLTCN